jgi:hypothetical protein
VPVGGAPLANGSTFITATSPTSITLQFSGNIDRNSLKATDLVLSGSADNSSSPVHATSLTWIDGDTVQFNLSGPLSLPGTLNVSIAPNTITSVNGQGNLAYSDDVVIQIGTPPGVTNPTPLPPGYNPNPSPGTPTPTPTGTPPPAPSPVTPPPAPSPVSVHKKKPAKHVVHKPVHHAAPKHAKHAAPKHAKHAAPKHAKHAATKHAAHAATKHVVKTKTVHPRATTSLTLSLAGHKHKGK